MSDSVPFHRTIDRSLNYGRHLIRDYLDSIGKGQIRTVVDLGAGKGDDLMLARDVNPNASLNAIESYRPYQEVLTSAGIQVHAGNIERDKFPFSDESVDVIIANQILEHVKEVFWILHEVSRTIAIGGHFIIGVPNLASLHNRVLLAFGCQPSAIQNRSAHVRGYTKGDIIDIMESCFPGGYELVRFGGSNFYPFPPLMAKPLAAAFPTMAWGIFLMLRKQKKYHREFIDYPARKKLETNFYLGGMDEQ